MKSLDRFLYLTIGFCFLCIIASFVYMAVFGAYPEELMKQLIIYTLGEGGICGLIKAVKLITAEREAKEAAKASAEQFTETKTERT